MTTELQKNKWMVQNYDGDKAIVLDKVETGQSVYIYNIKDSVVQIKGKVTSICVDKAVKSGVVFTSSVGPLEIVNSKSVQVQGSAPNYSVDKSESITLFLGQADLTSEIFTSGSEVNVTVLPAEGSEADPVETPLPVQFVSKFEGGKWVTNPVSHVGV